MRAMEILYDDKWIVVCVKPVGICSESVGMPERLEKACRAWHIFCVHRLDTAVGGVMVYAKTKEAAAKLSAGIAAGKFRKEYLAVVEGKPAEDSALLRDLLFRDRKINKSYVVTRMRQGVKEAELEYETLESKMGMSLLRILLHTGRTHQIRVQFSSRALPLVGDVKYGSKRKDCGIALFAHSLAFSHPISGKALSFSADPPKVKPWVNFDYLKEGTTNV